MNSEFLKESLIKVQYINTETSVIILIVSHLTTVKFKYHCFLKERVENGTSFGEGITFSI